MNFELQKDARMFITKAKINKQNFVGLFQSAEIKHSIHSDSEQALE